LNLGEKVEMNILGSLLKDKLELVLRIGVFGVFLGHGIFALEGKQQFVVMIQSMVFVDSSTATTLLFAIGIIDILVAFSVLLKPQRYVLIYAAVWAFMTALARITAGDPVWDFVERAANWTVPLALLLYIQFKARVREKEVPLLA
jgi:hypothetical protein